MTAKIYWVLSMYQVLFQALKCNNLFNFHNFLWGRFLQIEKLGHWEVTWPLNSEVWGVFNSRLNYFLSDAEWIPNPNVLGKKPTLFKCVPQSSRLQSALHPKCIYWGSTVTEVALAYMVPPQYMRQKLQFHDPSGRKWLTSHGLSTNNDGQTPNENTTPPGRPPPEYEDIATGFKFQEHQQNLNLKVGRFPGSATVPTSGWNPILSREGPQHSGEDCIPYVLQNPLLPRPS